MRYDILIIGGGIIGLSIARELHKRGVRSVAVLEKDECGRKASWAAAGMLVPQVEADAGGPFFELCARSRDVYPQFAAELRDETGVDVELDRTGTLHVAFTDHEAEQLSRRYAWQQAAGLSAEPLSTGEVLKLEPAISSDIRSAWLFANDWQVENRKLVEALRRGCRISGIDIIEGTEALSIDVDSGLKVSTTTGDIAAGRAVLATGAWTSLIKLGAAEMPFDVRPVRGQMIMYRRRPQAMRHVVFSESGYLVPRRDGRILAGSTTENVGFDTSTTDEACAAIAHAASEIVPSLAGRQIAERWAGLRPCAADSIPVIGPVNDALFVATAHYRNGILLAPLTATLVADALVDGVADGGISHFGVERFRPRSVAHVN